MFAGACMHTAWLMWSFVDKPAPIQARTILFLSFVVQVSKILASVI